MFSLQKSGTRIVHEMKYTQIKIIVNFLGVLKVRSMTHNNNLIHLTLFCSLLHSPWECDFSCASSNHETLCMRIRTCCKQRVSGQCARACDISDRSYLDKRNCIYCKQRVSHQFAKVCDSSECLNPCKKSCTDRMQTVSHQYVAVNES